MPGRGKDGALRRGEDCRAGCGESSPARGRPWRLLPGTALQQGTQAGCAAAIERRMGRPGNGRCGRMAQGGAAAQGPARPTQRLRRAPAPQTPQRPHRPRRHRTDIDGLRSGRAGALMAVGGCARRGCPGRIARRGGPPRRQCPGGRRHRQQPARRDRPGRMVAPLATVPG